MKQWNQEINVGLTGYFLMSKIFGSQMSKNKYGRIINVASDLSIIAPDQRLYNENLKSEKNINYYWCWWIFRVLSC